MENELFLITCLENSSDITQYWKNMDQTH